MALGALCRSGGWSYAAIWRADRRDPRLLTMGESYCEDEARKVVDKMLNQVHIVGEGIIGGALVSGKCQWVSSDDTRVGLAEMSHADNLDLFQGYTWWQHQFLDGIKTIAVIPLPSVGVAQFGSMQKVSESSKFFDQVKNTLYQTESIPRVPSIQDTQRDVFTYDQHGTPSSISSLGDVLIRNGGNSLQSEAFMENLERTESLRSSICSSGNYSQRSLNALSSYDSVNGGVNPHIVAMPVNSKSINAFKGFHNVGNFPFHTTSKTQAVGPKTQLQVASSKQPDSSFASAISACTNATSVGGLNNLPRIEQKLSSDLKIPGFPSYLYTNTDSINSSLEFCHFGGISSSCAPTSEISKDCLHSEKLLDFRSLSSSSLSMGDKMKTISFGNIASSCVSEIRDSCLTPPYVFAPEQSLLLHPKESPSVLVPEESLLLYSKDSLGSFPIVQSDLAPEKDNNGFTAATELRNRTSEDPTAGTVDTGSAGCTGNNSAASQPVIDHDLLESMVFDLSANALMQDWWDDSVILAGNPPNFGTTASESITELGNGSILVGAKGLLAESVFEQLHSDNVGGDVNRATECGSVAVSTSPLAGCFSDCQLPKFAIQDCLSAYKTQVTLLSFPSSSYTSENALNGSSKALSKSPGNLSVDDSCSLNTANSKVSQPKKPEEAAKVIKKRARPGESTRPRPKDRQQIQDRVKELREIVPNGAKCSIDALLDRTIKHMLFLQSVTKYAEKIKQADEPKMIGKESGVVLKDNSSTAGSGGTTWAYEVAGQTMVCPIIVEDLAPPGQMLVEMLCEERGFFLEIAENIRGFGLTILKGLMELRDSKIWARFLVEANRDVTRMDIFLSLVQLLQQNSLVRSTDQLTKVINNGFPSFAQYQQSPISIPVGLAERLQ